MPAIVARDMPGAQLRARPTRAWTAHESWFGFDAFFCFAIVTVALFATQLGSPIGVLLPGLVVLFGLVRREKMPDLVARTWPILLLGGFAIFSTVWSVEPGYSAYYGLQYLITLVGAVMIGSGCIPKQALRGLFAAMVVHSIATTVFGYEHHYLDLIHPVEDGFYGLAGSKNTNADMCCLGAFVGLTMMRSAWRDDNILLALIALMLVVLDVLIIRACKSAGVDAAGAIGLVAFLALSRVHTLPLRWRNGLTILLLAVGLIAGGTQSLWFKPLFKEYAQSSGKDESLTGRTYIWSRAQVQVDKRPWLGGGYCAFWIKGKLESEAIWKTMGVSTRMGFNFHNSVYDLLVAFGYVGLTFFTIIYTISISRLVSSFINHEYQISILWVVVVIYELVRFSWEALPTGIFAHNTLYIYAALGHGGGVAQGRVKAAGLAARGTSI